MPDDRDQNFSAAPKGTPAAAAGQGGVTGGDAGGAGGETGSAAGTGTPPDRIGGGLTADERTQPGRDRAERDPDVQRDLD